jgi:hypothetical protein
MKNLKEILRKPAILWSAIGALGLTTGILTFKNIGLKNQNNYLFNERIEMSKIYPNLVDKYSRLIEDSMKISNQHSLELISLRGDKLELAIKFDSLQKSYTTSAENLIKNYLKLDYEGDSLIKSLKKDSMNFANESFDMSQENRNLFEIAVMFKEENDFFKKYNNYLDSLLLRCESKNMLQDKK